MEFEYMTQNNTQKHDIKEFNDVIEFAELIESLPDARAKKIHVEGTLNSEKSFNEYNDLTSEEDFWSKKHVAIVNQSTNQVARIAGSGYRILQHKHFFGKVLDMLNTIGITNISGYVNRINGGNSVAARIIFNDMIIEEPSMGRNIKIGCEFLNSYDKEYAARGSAYNLRLSCTNQMILRNLIKEWVFSRAHVAQNEEQLLDIVSDKQEQFLKLLLSSETKFKSAMNEAIYTNVTYEHPKQIEVFMQKLLQTKKHGENIAEMVHRKAIQEGNHYNVSKWDIYNGMTDYTTHETEGLRNFEWFQFRAEKDVLMNEIKLPSYESVKDLLKLPAPQATA
jgi:hypothetical protein